MKNKHYFLRLAILKTMATGFLYLAMPIVAKIYHNYVGWDYVGYTAFGAGVMILGNLTLLIRAWALAFDKDLRKNYLKED
jgi:hypothetical protein